MATLNFKQAHTFSITGGIYSSARHVTMISGIVDPQIIARDYFQHSRSPRSSRRRSRTPSPSSTDSSFVFSDASDASSPSRQSSPPTSVDEHESLSSQTVPPSFHENRDALSPLSSRLGAMTGLRTPVHRQTPIASEWANIPETSRSSDTIRPAIPQPDELSASVRTPVSARFYRHPGIESIRDIDTRIRPLGPRRRRPLPPTPMSQAVHPGALAGSLSTTGSPSRAPGSSSSQQTSWDSVIQGPPPHSVVRSSTAPPRPSQPIRSSRHTLRADVLTPSPSYATHNNHISLSSSSQARSPSSHTFLTSPLRQSFAESVTTPSRRSVQSPPPNQPFHSLPLPLPSTQSRASPSTPSLLSPPRNHPFQSIPLPPRSTPPRAHTAAGSMYTPSQASRQPFHSPPVWQPYQSSAWSTGYPEINMQPPVLYYYHSQPQNLPNQDFIYSSPSGAPQQYLSRSPRFAADFTYLPQPPYLFPPQSQQSSYEHSYRPHDGPSMSISH